MKKIIKLTESDLRGIIKKSVNKILKEDLSDFKEDWSDLYDGDSYDIDWKQEKEMLRKNPPKNGDYLIYEDTPDFYYIGQVANDMGLPEDDEYALDKAAIYYFSSVDIEEEKDRFYRDSIDKNCRQVKTLKNGAIVFCSDYSENYFLAIKIDSASSPMSMALENKIARSVRESLTRLIETDCAGVMQTGCGNAPKGTNPEAGQYTVPLGADKETADRTPGFSVKDKAKWNKNPGNVQRRPIYNPKS